MPRLAVRSRPTAIIGPLANGEFGDDIEGRCQAVDDRQAGCDALGLDRLDIVFGLPLTWLVHLPIHATDGERSSMPAERSRPDRKFSFGWYD